ncbi:sensor domain-containing protein [Mycobacterium bourgelatii]|uniref:Sensor domain-containing protein n=1 Tax=Mycobacterium bourgelatii TaxID=1273442 RepID=A0A7I9YSZ2_MYCBU|nr:sensor domain-containing protein [Mycobacterium bourgelatii]MCV6973346.1 sensor domain-containing protein [Mycobacterium bourgelatii]GFG91755.1 sensor domain-containing protein [Mycobacterium bourgelatii]
MRFRCSVVVVALVALLTAGCTDVVNGLARPGPDTKPHPLLGDALKPVLLDDSALSDMLGQAFESDPDLPPRFGGGEKLLSPYGEVTPDECVGVVTLTNRRTYDSAPVVNVAHETWWHTSYTVKVISVAESVIALPSVKDASALFGKFTDQWKACNGKSVTLEGDDLSFTDEISDVRVANSVLAATLSESSSSTSTSRAVARAIGVRVNCLVEVQVSFFSPQESDTGTGDPNTSAIEIARAMMDKITART